MIMNKILFIITLVNFALGYAPIYCPSGDTSKATCGYKQKCSNENHYCLDFPDDLGHHCCDMAKSFCNETGMASFPTLYDDWSTVSYKDRATNYDLWYDVIFWIDGLRYESSCPYPLSYHLRGQHGLPDGFKYYKKVNRCKVSKDCKSNQICDYVFNESFLNRDGIYANYGMDRSDHGKSVQFCFEIPELLTKHPHKGYGFDRNAVGFNMCNKEEDCPSGNICFASDKIEDEMYRYLEAGKPTAIDFERADPLKVRRGVCLVKQEQKKEVKEGNRAKEVKEGNGAKEEKEMSHAFTNSIFVSLSLTILFY